LARNPGQWRRLAAPAVSITPLTPLTRLIGRTALMAYELSASRAAAIQELSAVWKQLWEWRPRRAG
jgi:hypothetical protein